MKRRTLFSAKPRQAMRTGNARAFCESLEPRVLLSAYSLSTRAVFGANLTGANPNSAVVMDAGGNLYGTTSKGGANGGGTVYEIVAGSGKVTPLASFTSGDEPNGVVLDRAGNLFGATAYGGADGLGAVFEVVRGSGTITTLASFDGTNGEYPNAIIIDAAGNLYGTTGGGITGTTGRIFKIKAGRGTIITLASNLVDTNGRLTLDGSGNLYGTMGVPSWQGGDVFELAAGSGAITTLASFYAGEAEAPNSAIVDGAGNLYFTTNVVNAGKVYEIAHGSSTFTQLGSFPGSNTGLAIDGGGNVYGDVAEYAGGGSIFKIAAGSAAFTTPSTPDVNWSPSGITADANGNLYIAEANGGANNTGCVVERLANGKSAILTSFGAYGIAPNLLTVDGSGNLYGTTQDNGASGSGTIFEIAQGSTTINTLASFSSPNTPNTLIVDANDNLYGTTPGGGDSNGDGTVFEIPHGSGTVITLASFDGANGSRPGTLVLDASGNLYGTTISGSDPNARGTIFEIVRGSGTITTLASFSGAGGGFPNGLVVDRSGNLYGTTSGSAEGNGAIFELAGGSSTIVTLTYFNYNDITPLGGLVLDRSGNLYGIAAGVNLSGETYETAFELARGSSEINSLAAAFYNVETPGAGIVVDASGNLYGTISDPNGGGGSVFEIPRGSAAFTGLAVFQGADGTPNSLILDASGNLYGTANNSTNGSVFELTPSTPPRQQPPASRRGQFRPGVIRSNARALSNGSSTSALGVGLKFLSRA